MSMSASSTRRSTAEGPLLSNFAGGVSLRTSYHFG